MHRRTFPLSWGRKIFFGFAWPVFLVLSLIYLQSKIVPQGTASWIYYLSTMIGHYGLVTAILYFIFYYPVVWLVPSYYISRFWSLFLILATGLYIFFDAVIFNQYRHHLNNNLFDLIFSKSEAASFTVMSKMILGIAIVVFSLIFWLRGERIWRSMQGRFSNPNKNWYLVVIVLSLATSHLMHIWGKASEMRSVTNLAQIFPLHYPATANKFLAGRGIVSAAGEMNKKGQDFHYPKHAMKCTGSENKNVLMIVIEGWKESELHPYVTPMLTHLAGHGVNFTNHYSNSTDVKGSIFSLMYSLPSMYWNSASDNQKSPVLMNEFFIRNYDLGVFTTDSLVTLGLDKNAFLKVAPLHTGFEGTTPADQDQKLVDSWKAWLKQHKDSPEERPFFGFLSLASANFANAEHLKHELAVNNIDFILAALFEDLYKKGLNSETIIIVTGDRATAANAKVPMFMIWPDKKRAVETKLTSHFDIVPTIMDELWHCKNETKSYSFGENLYNLPERDSVLVMGEKNYGIIDFASKKIINVDSKGAYELTDLDQKPLPKEQARVELIFKSMKDLIRFNK